MSAPRRASPSLGGGRRWGRLTPARVVARVLAPRPSPVVEGSLEDGMLFCLGLLAGGPDRFEAAAVAWHARWCARLPGIEFAESRAALSALEGLTGPARADAARALSGLCRRHGLEQAASLLDAWLQGLPRPITAAPPLPPLPTPAA